MSCDHAHERDRVAWHHDPRLRVAEEAQLFTGTLPPAEAEVVHACAYAQSANKKLLKTTLEAPLLLSEHILHALRLKV